MQSQENLDRRFRDRIAQILAVNFPGARVERGVMHLPGVQEPVPLRKVRALVNQSGSRPILEMEGGRTIRLGKSLAMPPRGSTPEAVEARFRMAVAARASNLPGAVVRAGVLDRLGKEPVNLYRAAGVSIRAPSGVSRIPPTSPQRAGVREWKPGTAFTRGPTFARPPLFGAAARRFRRPPR